MHEAFLKHIRPKPPPELASTTFIHRIFGGKLRSEVGASGSCACFLQARWPGAARACTLGPGQLLLLHVYVDCINSCCGWLAATVAGGQCCHSCARASARLCLSCLCWLLRDRPGVFLGVPQGLTQLAAALPLPGAVSQIVCEGVEYRSATFDPFLDLSLEITKANNLARALQHFTAEEVLDGDNRYRCPKNNKLVSFGLEGGRMGAGQRAQEE